MSSTTDTPTTDASGPDTPTGPIPAVADRGARTVDGGTGPDTGRHRLRVDAGGPGTTRFDQAAVEKLAAHAIGEVEHVGGAANRMLGVAVGSDHADRSPKVSAQLDGAVVTVQVRLSVYYPAPVGQVTRTVREHLRERLSTLAGLDARRVDIAVAALHTPHTPVRRLA